MAIKNRPRKMKKNQHVKNQRKTQQSLNSTETVDRAFAKLRTNSVNEQKQKIINLHRWIINEPDFYYRL
jgi:hypothetical protein